MFVMLIHRLLLIFLMDRLLLIDGYIPKVHLRDTLITGYTLKSIHGRDIDAFNNIPYAEPPVGDLRFKPSVLLKHLPKVFNASFPDSVICIQFDTVRFMTNIIGREDCLFVNVYMPRQREVTKLLPVLVVIHGGAFMFLSNTDLLFGPNKLLDFDIVVVTVNYRLGVLGFLSTGDEASPGNYALWDILTSLQWVQKNIRSFGGNPNNVTLLGQSSGAMCVTVLMVSPLAKGLFHKVIIQSGTIFTPRILQINPLQEAQALADAFWCPITPTQVLVDCLRKQPAKKLIHYGYVIPLEKTIRLFPRFRPVIDYRILPKHPYILYSKGLFHRVPVIIGVNRDEGLFFYYLMFRTEFRYYEDETNFLENHLNVIFKAVGRIPESVTFLKDRINEYYLKDVNKSDYVEYRKATIKTSTLKILRRLIREYQACISDLYFSVPTVNFVHHIFNLTTTYFYSYEYKSHFGLTDIFSILNDPFSDNISITHADELKFIFSGFFDFMKISKSEMDFQDTMLKLWSNFIISGNPTPDGFPVKWHSLRTSNIEFLLIREQLTMQTNFLHKEVHFINSIVFPCLNKLEKHLFVQSGIEVDFDMNCPFNVTEHLISNFSNYWKPKGIRLYNFDFNYYIIVAVFIFAMILYSKFIRSKTRLATAQLKTM